MVPCDCLSTAQQEAAALLMHILRWAALHYQETVQNDETWPLVHDDESVSRADANDDLDVWEPFITLLRAGYQLSPVDLKVRADAGLPQHPDVKDLSASRAMSGMGREAEGDAMI